MIYKEEVFSREWRFLGQPISPGISVGKMLLLSETEVTISELTLAYEEVEYEINRYYKALRNSHSDIISLQKQAEKQRGGDEIVSILKSHIDIIKDPILTEDVVNAIRKRCKNAEYVFSSIIGEIEEKFIKSGKQFLSERVQDIQDVSKRIIGYLCSQGKESFRSFSKNLIIFSKEMAPSMVAEVNTSFIKAIVTEKGSHTSHTAIVCRAKGIPYVSHIDFSKFISSIRKTGSISVIVDGNEGDVIVNPSPQTLDYYYKKSRLLDSGNLVVTPISTKKIIKGVAELKISANVDSIDQVNHLKLFFPDTGIGLFRSEFLALRQKDFPCEESQFSVYKTLAQHMPSSSVVRAFDLGDDKIFLNQEKNKKFMDNYRAIRFLLNNEEIFKTQIRAILRATAFGSLRLLLPMITDIIEVRKTRVLIEQVKEELTRKKEAFVEKNFSVGCMIEVPSAVMCIDSLSKESDFFSIGTNDLSQFTLGISREKQAPTYLSSLLHPSLIRMIKLVIDGANSYNIPLSVCGEASKEQDLLPIFLGLGIKELSVPLNYLDNIHQAIRNIDIQKAQSLAKESLLTCSQKELEECLNKFKNNSSNIQ